MIWCGCVRRELRAATDERVHDAVVSNSVRYVSSQINSSASLGRGTPRRIGDTSESICRHLGHHAEVSQLWFFYAFFLIVVYITLRKQRRDHITADIRDLLHWLPVQRRIESKMCVLIYKCLHQLAPIYLSELCLPVAATATRSHLRSAVQGNLCLLYTSPSPRD